MQYYILAKTTGTAEDVADSYLNNIWKLYGLLTYITLDRGLQFDSKFMKELNQKLYINQRLSTAYYPQRDGLSEQAIQRLNVMGV